MNVLRLVFLIGFFSSSILGEDKKPNVIFILADDLGYNELGCYGQKKIQTPNIDSLADDGMKFTRHYSGNAVCAPSRCVLMTGKHPGHAYIRNNRPVKPEGQEPIPEDEKTLAEYFKDLGYVTGAFGKWGLGPTHSSGDPNKQGFDEFFGYNCQAKAHTYYPASLWHNDKIFPLKNTPPIPGHANLPKGVDKTDPKSYDMFKGQDYAPEHINRQALKFIDKHRDKPFFLYYPSIIPHVALHVPDKELVRYNELGWDDPPFTRDGGGYTPHYTPRAAYASMITLLDKYVGRLVLALDLYGIADNTIVIFTSDNGTTHLKKEVDYDFFNSVGRLRGLKGSLYEGGIRVPLIVKWPGKIKPGSTSEILSGFEDWIPTLMSLVGQPIKKKSSIDGFDLSPALFQKGDHDSLVSRKIYREFAGYRGQQAIWFGPWKGIRQGLNVKNNSSALDIQLYHVDSDPSESKNIASDFPDVVEKARILMKREHTPSKLFPIRALDNN